MKASDRTGRSRQGVESIRPTCCSGRSSKPRRHDLCLRRTSTLVRGGSGSCRSGCLGSTSPAGRGTIPPRATHSRPVSTVGLRPFLHAGRGDPDSALAAGSQSTGGGRREGYDAGAKMLWDFFCRELQPLSTNPDLLPEGREIISCCLSHGTLAEFESVLAFGGAEVGKNAT